jgi:hypothetical protein
VLSSGLMAFATWCGRQTPTAANAGREATDWMALGINSALSLTP